MTLLSYKTGNGRSRSMEGPAHLLAPLGFLMEFSFHTSVHRIVEQTYTFISSKAPLGMFAADSVWMSLFSPSASRGQ